MLSLILKLFALIAYMAMPFTMSVAMSAPPPSSHHAEMMAMAGMGAMQHCPEQSAPAIDHTAFVGCGMMCAALPADLAEPAAIVLAAAVPPVLPVRHFTGILLEIATPPPRLA